MWDHKLINQHTKPQHTNTPKTQEAKSGGGMYQNILYKNIFKINEYNFLYIVYQTADTMALHISYVADV